MSRASHWKGRDLRKEELLLLNHDVNLLDLPSPVSCSSPPSPTQSNRGDILPPFPLAVPTPNQPTHPPSHPNLIPFDGSHAPLGVAVPLPPCCCPCPCPCPCCPDGAKLIPISGLHAPCMLATTG